MSQRRRSVAGAVALAAFVGSVWLANWLLHRYGVVPIGFGLSGPAGVYAAGLAFGLRDAVHETLGRRWVLVGIIAGSALAWLLGANDRLGGPVPIAAASALAFAVSEVADLLIYEPIRRRHWAVAVAASNVVGSVVDSALFLWLAFGSLTHLLGQVVGKSYMVALSVPLVWLARRALSRDRLRPAGA